MATAWTNGAAGGSNPPEEGSSPSSPAISYGSVDIKQVTGLTVCPTVYVDDAMGSIVDEEAAM